MAVKKGNEIATIDVVLVTYKVGETEIGMKTASKVDVSVQSETTDAVKLIVKGVLIAQKREQTTVTGHTITLTDNVLIPELVKMLQGGTIKYWKDSGQSAVTDTDARFGVASYTPPVAGSEGKVKEGVLSIYSAIYDAAGLITGYEKCEYPNCKGVPVAFNVVDGEFRAPEYTINSAPKTGEAPYTITYLKELPELTA